MEKKRFLRSRLVYLILGAVYLLLMDGLARSLLSLELPLGVVTSIAGAPFFICLICKRRGR